MLQREKEIHKQNTHTHKDKTYQTKIIKQICSKNGNKQHQTQKYEMEVQGAKYIEEMTIQMYEVCNGELNHLSNVLLLYMCMCCLLLTLTVMNG